MAKIQQEPFIPAGPHREARFSEPRHRKLHWDPFLDSYLTDVASRVAPVFIPPFDIRETPDSYLFLADLPGIEPEDLEIKLQGNRLTVAGVRLAEPLPADTTVYSAERTVGPFSRAFNLPDNIDGDRATASVHNGTLLLLVPKRNGTEAGPSRVVPISQERPL